MANGRIIEAAETQYNEDASLQLRLELIKTRDKMLVNNDFEGAVLLSHTIAWMTAAIRIVYAE